MKNFIFQNKTKIIFGKDTEKSVGKECSKIGKRALVHYGSDRIKKNGLLDTVAASLKAEGISFVEVGGVKPNPRLSLVREGIKVALREKVDMVLAIGGGSVIDSAKGIAVGARLDGDIWDCCIDKVKEIDEMMPLGTILTIPAAGSESSTGSVITNEATKQKFYFGYPESRPTFSILNPELTYSLPPDQTSYGVADMITHIMERYFTRIDNVDLTDRLCEATLKTIIFNAKKVLKDSNDYNARAEIMWCGTIAHNDILDTGRMGDWASHDIEHELSAQYDVTHGAGLAVIFPAWMRYVLHEDLGRFVQFANRVWDVPYITGRDEEIAYEGIRRHLAFYASIGLPTSLSDLGINDNRYKGMAKQACRRGSLGNFKKLKSRDVEKIYRIAETQAH
jgi:alcohol dehydrogenase YqhD (iron-dependent ADH family)